MAQFRGNLMAFVGLGDQQCRILGSKVEGGGGRYIRVDSSTRNKINWGSVTHIIMKNAGGGRITHDDLMRLCLVKPPSTFVDPPPPCLHFNFINQMGTTEAATKNTIHIEQASCGQSTSAVTESLDSFLADSTNSGVSSPSKSLKPNPLLIAVEGVKQKNLNEHITKVFKELVELLPPGMDSGNTFRRRSYNECIRSLSRLPEKVTNMCQVQNRKLAGFGVSNLGKLEQILKSDDNLCVKLRDLREKPEVKLIAEFRNIWGIGTKRAISLYHDFNCRNIEDVRKLDREQPTLFNNMIKIGLKRFEDMLLPVPSEEAKRIFSTVEAAAKKINPYSEALICGSARRQDDSTSSDVDVLIIIPTNVSMGIDEDASDQDWDFSAEAKLLQLLIVDLTAQGTLTDHGAGVGEGKAYYMGVCVDTSLEQPSLHRRIDIKVYPKALRACGLLSFTGNVNFNRALSAYANKFITDSTPFGLKNTKVGLFRRTGNVDRHGESIQHGRIPCNSEEDIFAALHLQYRPPTERFSLDDLLPIAGCPAAKAAFDAVKTIPKKELEFFERGVNGEDEKPLPVGVTNGDLEIEDDSLPLPQPLSEPHLSKLDQKRPRSDEDTDDEEEPSDVPPDLRDDGNSVPHTLTPKRSASQSPWGDDQQPNSGAKPQSEICYICKGKGHWSYACPKQRIWK